MTVWEGEDVPRSLARAALLLAAAGGGEAVRQVWSDLLDAFVTQDRRGLPARCRTEGAMRCRSTGGG